MTSGRYLRGSTDMQMSFQSLFDAFQGTLRVPRVHNRPNDMKIRNVTIYLSQTIDSFREKTTFMTKYFLKASISKTKKHS